MTEIELRQIAQAVAQQVDTVRPRLERGEGEFAASSRSITLRVGDWVVFIDCTEDGKEEKLRLAVCSDGRSQEDPVGDGSALHSEATFYFWRGAADAQWRDENRKPVTMEEICRRVVADLRERSALGEDLGVTSYGDGSGNE